jgi:hypothetical protein
MIGNIVADGFCCKGCGCRPTDFGVRVINPILVERLAPQELGDG